MALKSPRMPRSGSLANRDINCLPNVKERHGAPGALQRHEGRWTHSIVRRQSFFCLCLTTEIAPRFVQLTTKLAYPTATQTKLRGRIARPVADAEIPGNLASVGLERLEPCSKVDSHSGCLSGAGVFVFHQNLIPRILFGIVVIESFENEILSLPTIIA